MQRMRDVLRGSLSRSLRELGPEDRLTAAWQVVCGAALAVHGEITHLDPEDVLHVRVREPQWMGEFIDRRSALAADLARVAGVKLAGIHFDKPRTPKPPGRSK
jgi:hypothetical protein